MMSGIRAMGSGDLSRWVSQGGSFSSRRSASAPQSGDMGLEFPSLTEEMLEDIVPKTVRLPADVVEELLKNSAWDGGGSIPPADITYSFRNKVKRALQQMLKSKMATGSTDVEKAAYLHSLGALIDDEGKYSKAEGPLGQALKLRMQVLGEEHRDTLFTQHLLGLVWMSQNTSSKLAKAEKTLEHCLQTQTRVLGEDDPDTLRTMNGLGALHYTRGKHSEAEALYSKCLQKRQAVLGSTHKDTLATIHNLSLLYKGEQGHTAALLKLAFL